MSDLPPPTFPPNVAMVDIKTGMGSAYFLDWLLRTLRAIVTQGNSNAQILAALQASNAAAQSAQAAAAAAQAAAAAAQATADAGGGSPTARSGNGSSTFSVGVGWSNGPQVNLLTVSAGNLTIQGSGPQQTPSTDTTAGNGVYNGQWRIQELAPGPGETTVFSGTFQVAKSYDGEFGVFIIDLYNQTDTTSVSIPLATTGTVSYRLDLQMVDPVTVTFVNAVLYVRRS